MGVEELAAFAKNELGVEFENIRLLEQALVHRSYINENPGYDLDHNERLEFLGDAVLEIVVTDYLYHHFENPEGELTSIRAALVNTEMLAKKSHELGYEEYLRLSRGEAKDTGRARDSILANTFEAVLGAIYLDQGLEVSRAFVERVILVEAEVIVRDELWRDPKSKFQEHAQEKNRMTPEYHVIDESGPDHDKKFVIGVYIGDEEVARGEGSSKQEAQIDAARRGLKAKGW